MSIYLATFGKLRYLGLARLEEDRGSGWVLLKTMRGLEVGFLEGPLTQEQEAGYRAIGRGQDLPRGPEPMLQEVQVLRDAGGEDMEVRRQCRHDEDEVLVRAREILAAHRLQMKLVDVEYMMDRKKLFFYFTAEQRVDFRGYVRDLAREFHTRIEMRQIGVRDEARTVKGIASCGRPCCCSYWLQQFAPIGIRMVKEQKLALNPTKISGICGRLMCCMAFEYPVYEELWKDLPGPGTKIKTPQGVYVLENVDLATSSAEVRCPSGRLTLIPVGSFREFRETVLRGEPWGEEEDARKKAPPLSRRLRLASRARQPGAAREKVPLEEHLARERKKDVPPKQESERRRNRRRRRPRNR